jgi:hypothetical protein
MDDIPLHQESMVLHSFSVHILFSAYSYVLVLETVAITGAPVYFTAFHSIQLLFLVGIYPKECKQRQKGYVRIVAVAINKWILDQWWNYCS